MNGVNSKCPYSDYLDRIDAQMCPIWEKSLLTIEEAAYYSGIGRNKLRELTDGDDCSFVLWNGSKRMIKREKLDEYLDAQFSI